MSLIFSTEEIFIYFFFIAGSAGDPNAPQFIVENRAVALEYARDNGPPNRMDINSNNRNMAGGTSYEEKKPSTIKSDWICDSVSINTRLYYVILRVFIS